MALSSPSCSPLATQLCRERLIHRGGVQEAAYLNLTKPDASFPPRQFAMLADSTRNEVLVEPNPVPRLLLSCSWCAIADAQHSLCCVNTGTLKCFPPATRSSCPMGTGSDAGVNVAPTCLDPPNGCCHCI
jgi:hypothetical protein